MSCQKPWRDPTAQQMANVQKWYADIQPSGAASRGGDPAEPEDRMAPRVVGRARVRPMAGDSPSGYSLAGQSGLV